MKYLVLSGSCKRPSNASNMYALPHLKCWSGELLSLNTACRLAVRQHLKTCKCRDIYSAVSSLPAPLPLIRYLNMTDLMEKHPNVLSNFTSTPAQIKLHACTL